MNIPVEGIYFGKLIPIDSKPCWEVIDGFSDISDAEKEIMKEELPED